MQVTQCYLFYCTYRIWYTHTHTHLQTHGPDDLLKQWEEKRRSTKRQWWRGRRESRGETKWGRDRGDLSQRQWTACEWIQLGNSRFQRKRNIQVFFRWIQLKNKTVGYPWRNESQELTCGDLQRGHNTDLVSQQTFSLVKHRCDK